MIIDMSELEPGPARKALVRRLQKQVKGAKGAFEKQFKQMREDMEIAQKGFGSDWSSDQYVAHITLRHIHNRTAALYAKNPKASAKRRERIENIVWDGNPKTVQDAVQQMMMGAAAGMPPDPMSAQIVQEFISLQENNKLLDKAGKTLELLFAYFIGEGIPATRVEMKRLVSRAIVTGVGYVKLGFQREMEPSADVSARIADITNRLRYIERLIHEQTEGDKTRTDAEAEELRLTLEGLQAQPMQIVREGLVFDFPPSTSLIPDPACKCLKGFIGADWVAQELRLTDEELAEVYNFDVSKVTTQTSDQEDGDQARPDLRSFLANDGDEVAGDEKPETRKIWELYHKPSGLKYVLGDGLPDFLAEPAPPDIFLERFWPFYTLIFNEVEHEDKIYPPSDVRLMYPMQQEFNRSRQALREHRQANRPKYAAPAGVLEDEDKEKLRTHPSSAVIELQSLDPGQKVGDILQPIQMVGIDQNVYNTAPLFDDLQLVVGSQEAHFGGLSNATATETSIAESARVSGLESQQDELDHLLSELAHGGGQILLMHMTAEQVRKIVGKGAVWPEYDIEQIVEDLFLDIQAGSSGRPNRVAELQSWERLLPILTTLPGISPNWLARESIKRLDDKADLNEALADTLPSIMALNQLAQVTPAIGTPDDPNAQGGQGGDNAERPAESQGSDAPFGDNQQGAPLDPSSLAGLFGPNVASGAGPAVQGPQPFI